MMRARIGTFITGLSRVDFRPYLLHILLSAVRVRAPAVGIHVFASLSKNKILAIIWFFLATLEPAFVWVFAVSLGNRSRRGHPFRSISFLLPFLGPG